MSDQPTDAELIKCVHRGPKAGYKRKEGGGCTCKASNREQLWTCKLYNKPCTLNPYYNYAKAQNPARLCSTCEDFTPPSDAE